MSEPGPHILDVEQVDLAELVEILRGRETELVGSLTGRSRMRDIVAEHLDCSMLEAEQLVDTLIAQGFVHLERTRKVAKAGASRALEVFCGSRAVDHLRQEPHEDLRLGLSGAEETSTSRSDAEKSSRCSVRTAQARTTLIGVICGIVNPTAGTVLADGDDIIRDFRAARSKIGLVPQELSTTCSRPCTPRVSFSRGSSASQRTRLTSRRCCASSRSGQARQQDMTLSGGMSARAHREGPLHEPQILFSDDPLQGSTSSCGATCGRWFARCAPCVTIILTTHYHRERSRWPTGSASSTRVRSSSSRTSSRSWKKLGKKQLILLLDKQLTSIPEALSKYGLELANDGTQLVFTFHADRDRSKIAALLRELAEVGIDLRICRRRRGCLEEIFVSLVRSDV